MTATSGTPPAPPARFTVTVDRTSPVPLYFQVAQQIEASIDDGTLVPGSRLVNEIQLADQLGLSRPTVRRAIQHLVDKGLLVRKRGVGTQVLHGQVKRQLTLSSLYDDLERTHRVPATRVLAFRTEPAAGEVSVALGVADGTLVYAIERLRFASGEPLAIMHNWIPVEIAVVTEDELAAVGLYAVLRSAGIHLKVANQQVGAASANAAQAKLLGERKGAALLTMSRTTFDDVGRAIEFASHAYRAGLYFFEMTVVDH